ncbi:hypothetical protein AMJ80_00385 [bacterium SM23_31]|nr:MAG: hypothetical protein AMJ80_00385 [bacterium SM23_31]
MIVFNIFSVFAQEKTGKIIGSINVEGNISTPEQIILLNSGLLRFSEEVFAEDFANAVRELWKFNQFSDIQIYTSNPNDRIINVTIKVEEYPSLNQVSIAGNEKIDENKILGLINFYSGQKINPSRILTGKQRIKNLYAEKGYLLAQISDSLVTREDKRIDIVYVIDEGEKIKIKNINFIGNNTFDEKTLRKELKQTKQDGLFRGGDFDRLKYEEDKKNLIEFYKKEGYTYAAVLSDSIYYDVEKKYMNILIRIDEGELYYFRNIAFEGNAKFTDEELEKVVDIKKGDKFNSEKLVKSLDLGINAMYYQIGHLNTQTIPYPIPVGADSIDITYYIEEGGPFKLNRINIAGNTKTKDKVIRREIKIKPGDIFSNDLIQRSARDITMLNYFSFIDLDIKMLGDVNEPEQEEAQEVDITFKLEEKSTDTANMAAGYSQRDGLIGSLGLSMNNLLGNGQQLFIDWQFGKIFRSFQIGFTEPWLFDTPTLAGFNIFDTHRGGPFYGFDHDSKGAMFRIGRRLKWPDDYFRSDLFFEVSKNKYSNVSIDLQQYLINREKTTRVSVTQIISRDSRGNRKNPAIAAEFPSNGSTVTFSTQFSGGILGGTENYIKYILGSEWYTPAMFDFVLYNNIEVGFIDNFNAQSNISLQELFFMGGSALTIGTPLRGYRERAVGPLSSAGNPIGGKAMMKVTTELRFNISPNPTIYGLLFAEAGNNWIDISFVDPFNLKRSVGVGARLFMPMIGMIGIDIGYGFENYDAYGRREGWMPHFVFGRGF